MIKRGMYKATKKNMNKHVLLLIVIYMFAQPVYSHVQACKTIVHSCATLAHWWTTIVLSNANLGWHCTNLYNPSTDM